MLFSDSLEAANICQLINTRDMASYQTKLRRQPIPLPLPHCPPSTTATTIATSTTAPIITTTRNNNLEVEKHNTCRSFKQTNTAFPCYCRLVTLVTWKLMQHTSLQQKNNKLTFLDQPTPTTAAILLSFFEKLRRTALPPPQLTCRAQVIKFWREHWPSETSILVRHSWRHGCRVCRGIFVSPTSETFNILSLSLSLSLSRLIMYSSRNETPLTRPMFG